MMVTPTIGKAFHDRAKRWMNGKRNEWMKEARLVIREGLSRTVTGRRVANSRKQGERNNHVSVKTGKIYSNLHKL